MKVLIISHTVISKTGNVGKTIRSYFRDFSVDEIAQFYIHSEIPTDESICHNYYRFTDQDSIKSFISHKSTGRKFTKEDIETYRTTTRTDKGMLASIYQFGRRRSGAIYLARNLLWKISAWKNQEFRKWIIDYAPDLLFFMSGDYGFMYDIALYAADLVNKPLVVCCVDDYYLHNRNDYSVAGRWVYRQFVKKFDCVIRRASCVFSICDKMSQEYADKFSIPCYTLHTAAEKTELVLNNEATQFSYIGNLGYNRYMQLLAIGRAIKSLHRDKEPRMLDVYSAESRTEIVSLLSEENGIRFHGSISADQVKTIMSNSMAVIHTESFEQKYQDMTRYSVSTKIAESLMSGPCLLAYGPEGIASIDYLREHQAAYVITSEADLQTGLSELISNAKLRADIVANARKLAQQNHTEERNSKMLREKLEEIIIRNV